MARKPPNLNDLAKKRIDVMNTISKEEFERLKNKYNNTYNEYKKRLSSSTLTPASTTSNYSGISGSSTVTIPNTYGSSPNTYGTVTTGPLTGGNSYSYYYDSNTVGINRPALPSFGERVFGFLADAHDWKRNPIKEGNPKWEELIGKLIPEVQGYYYYKRLAADEANKNNNNTAANTYFVSVITLNDTTAISNYNLALECLILDYALKSISADKEYLKKIIDVRTSSEWLIRLIFDSFGDMLRKMVDRDEGTGRSVDFSYYTWFVQYLRPGINTIYGELSVDTAQE
jgi:hypothetical protein